MMTFHHNRSRIYDEEIECIKVSYTYKLQQINNNSAATMWSV